MTLKLKPTSVAYMVEETVDGETVERDLSAEGRVQVVVQYYDDATPATILYQHTFIFGAQPFTSVEALEEMRAVGRRVRDTRVKASELSAYIGTAFNLDA